MGVFTNMMIVAQNLIHEVWRRVGIVVVLSLGTDLRQTELYAPHVY